ncbi:biotin--[acetyl-CoA-carboxylase] ligase [Helicobacter saguini]|uniref:Biotin--[acetyl-CoA-carboxylase] ligase n=1 Tax=Helicobacter saguini TaxID=1548018 RepID=A0A347VPA6_9HELI|nr:biotin--[acetyl-CoA-carboxylase] ligase [Helicobacter saguini]MWV61443.1 biotin--[acetyl-CoA-carboxylase] ligase [Helicobacter saguini]MWV67886.1 biotin--[acetyl-CoA-carboxylase] ligase [Helicobacter saguini]MWV70645.1 biotin--[acetyl-CoA-carboxylase] ligase [Helicobacter saguini]MWV72550.1 biotin--[acetyl-CoA-carboxylase] ligase [Helicobacter saguini]TLD94713.1 biotin--[acetyl-CoA-carboxylase] ligase [Helicobacter saguini]
MTFYYFQNAESTQVFLFNLLKDSIISNKIKKNQTPILVLAKEQSRGVGSRGNAWSSVKSGLYFSFLLHKSLLPNDIPPQSLSIYFGCIFLRFFQSLNKNLWLKWPNDFYLDSIESSADSSNKVGGIITQIYKDFIIFGIGLNLVDNNFKGILDYIDSITYKNIILKLLEFLGFKISDFDINKNAEIIESNLPFSLFLENKWSDIFELYKKQYYKNHNFKVHIDNKIISLKDSILQNDGSIKINDKIFYSLR